MLLRSSAASQSQRSPQAIGHRRYRLSKWLHVRFDFFDALAEAFELLAVLAVLLRRCAEIVHFGFDVADD